MEATIWFDALWTERLRERFSGQAGRNARERRASREDGRW